ncbi:MAG: BLUF domain-containing protein [Myxococcota bacterium]
MEDVSEEPELVHRLVYSSVATEKFSPDDLVLLLEKARAKNERMEVSGMLLHHEGNFIQVLEGDVEVVESLYSQIEHDARHDEPRILLREDEVERSFADWTMGFVRASREMIESIDGLNDFLRVVGEGSVGARDEGADDRARKILDQFKMGRWHRSIE